MTVTEVFQQAQALSLEERHELIRLLMASVTAEPRAYKSGAEIAAMIEAMETHPALADPEPPAGINLALLEETLADLREGLTQDDLAAITWAMNVEYVEPQDAAQWDDPATS